MPLTRLVISEFRNFTSAQFEPTPHGFNIICGANGSGKTSILEAMYYLSFGRSFRSTLSSRVVKNSAEKFTVFAHVTNDSNVPRAVNLKEQVIPVGLERELQGNLKIRVAGKDDYSIADLAGLIPIQLINSQTFNLLDAGPSYRRKFIDWGVFYQNPDFLRTWRLYTQTLKQRNAALRARRPRNELKTWDHELIAKALLLDAYRQDYLAVLCPLLIETLAHLLEIPSLKIAYQKGWEKEKDYSAVLETSYERDMQVGFTQFGPHRADLLIKIGNLPAKDILSRGQQKLFVCAMILAQGSLLKTVNKKPIYLIDDLPAELDVANRTKLIELISKQETQVFVTAVERALLNDSLTGLPAKMFHVEHSNVTES